MTADRADKAAFEASLARLRARFVEKLAFWHAQFTAFGVALEQEGQPDAAQLRSVHAEMHKLAGSAASFGFAALSEHAEQAERQLEAWLEGGEAVSSAALPASLSALREEMQRVLQAAP